MIGKPIIVNDKIVKRLIIIILLNIIGYYIYNNNIYIIANGETLIYIYIYYIKK